MYTFVDELRQIASALVFCVFEVGKNVEVQNKLRTELKERNKENDLLDFKYMCDTKTYLHNVIKGKLIVRQ